jgi:hypothetical protein
LHAFRIKFPTTAATVAALNQETIAMAKKKAATAAKPKPKERRKLIRVKDAQARLLCGHTKFYEQFINTGRLTLVAIGKRTKAAVEDEVDALVEEAIAARAEKAAR